VRPVAGSGSATGSDRAVDRLRRDLQPTLRALDCAAGDLDSLDALADDLPALQYALHVAAESPLVPDSMLRAEEAYDELEYALAAARDETADVIETLADAGPAGVAPLLWEWRAALFGVRLALLRLEQVGAVGEQTQPLPDVSVRPLLLLGPGVALVLGGALAGTWPLWILGLVLVTASTGLSRRP
jgi:hypothetical protein